MIVKRMRKSRPNLHCLQEYTQGYAAFSPTQGIGFSRKISFALGLFMACQRSQSCCKPNQKSADIPNTRDSRNAVSGVTERRPMMISLRRGYETPKRRASSVCVSSRGLTNSSKSISPGWVGGRFRGSHRPTTLSVVVCDFDLVGMAFLNIFSQLSIPYQPLPTATHSINTQRHSLMCAALHTIRGDTRRGTALRHLRQAGWKSLRSSFAPHCSPNCFGLC